jgi:hypothetical protein
MFETSTDVMHMSFAVGFIVIAIFFSLAMMYLVFVLRDISKVTHAARDVVDGVRTSITSPLKAISTIGDKIAPYIEEYVGKKSKKKK